jgi:hypothetical protein
LHLQKTGATDGVQELVRGQFHWSLTQGERVLHDLTRRGLIERTRDAITLTPAGEQAALRLEQAYRP